MLKTLAEMERPASGVQSREADHGYPEQVVVAEEGAVLHRANAARALAFAASGLIPSFLSYLVAVRGLA